MRQIRILIIDAKTRILAGHIGYVRIGLNSLAENPEGFLPWAMLLRQSWNRFVSILSKLLTVLHHDKAIVSQSIPVFTNYCRRSDCNTLSLKYSLVHSKAALILQEFPQYSCCAYGLTMLMVTQALFSYGLHLVEVEKSVVVAQSSNPHPMVGLAILALPWTRASFRASATSWDFSKPALRHSCSCFLSIHGCSTKLASNPWHWTESVSSQA